MPITSTGIGSGLDVESLVAQLVAAEVSSPVTRLSLSEAKYQAKISAYGSLKSALGELQGSISDISSLATFQKKIASSGGVDKVTVAASSEASAGTYQIGVSALASAQSLALAGTGYSSASDAVGTGTLSLSVGGTTEAFVLASGNNSLSSLVTQINSSDLAVTAAIINDGSGYKLVLTSDNSGTDNVITATVTGDGDGDDTDDSGLSRLASANLSETVPAANATLTINGLSITSQSNEVSSAVDGVTFSLKGTTEVGETIRTSVSNNTGAITTAVNGFIAGFNSFVEASSELTKYDSESGASSVLTGDATVRTIMSQLRNLLNTQVDNVSGFYRTLAELGITSNAKTGTLSLDSSQFNKILQEDPLDIANVLTTLGRSTNENMRYLSSTSATNVGNYAVDVSQTITPAILTGGYTDLATLGNYKSLELQFNLEVNGTTNAVTYTTPGSGPPPSLADVASGLEAAITAAFGGTQVVTVTGQNDPTNGDYLVFETIAQGEGSTINITAATGASNNLMGLGVQSGVDGASTVTGSIGGVAATYDAEAKTLTAAVGSAAEGLVVKILGQASGTPLGTIRFSQGITSSINSLLESLLDDDGLIDARLDGLNNSIKDIEKQMDALDLRASALEKRYREQFNGLETLISSLNTTQTYLSQALSGFVEPNTTLRK